MSVYNELSTYSFNLNLTKDWSLSNYQDSHLYVSVDEPNCDEYCLFGYLYFYLNPEIQTWFRNYKAKYILDWDMSESKWYVKVFDQTVALLYRMTFA